MCTLNRRILIVGVVSLASVGFALADDNDESKATNIQVLAIRATTKNTEISPELKQIADKLKKQFNFTGFKVEARRTGSAALGKSFDTALTGGYFAKITPKKNDGKRVELQIQVTKGSRAVLNTTLSADAGKFALQGGWDLDGGDKLIVAVAAK